MLSKLIYYVEDDQNIRQLIKYNLEHSGYQVETFETGELLLEKLAFNVPDLFCLDVMLPGISGIDLCKMLKNNNKTYFIPIIMITAKAEEFDKILGLEIGADDYITKPFSTREVLSRIKALLRRTNLQPPEDLLILTYRNITMDIPKHKVYVNDKEIQLSVKEFNLLKLLMKNKGMVITREHLLNNVWGYNYNGESRTVDVHFHYLRSKIEVNKQESSYIETVRGIGYRLKDI